MPSRASKSKLVDVREDRNSGNCTMRISKVELREDRNGDLHLVGYASTFDEYEVYGGPENYGWIEKIDRQAFTRTLSEKPDLHLLINHDGMPLARTTSGNLTLSVDDGGLKVDALLDKTDPDVQRLAPKMNRGDMNEMSFAFRVRGQEWSAAAGFEDDPMSYRLITELSLQRGDVSVVNYGANPHTSAALTTVGAAVGMLAHADMSELRSVDRRELREAGKALQKLARASRDADEDPAALLQALDAQLDEMLDIVDGIDVEAESAEVGQLCALVGGADAVVDQIMDLMGVYDADDDDAEGASAKGRARPMTQRKAKPSAPPARRKNAPLAPSYSGKRAHGNGEIARGIRIEVGGTEKTPEVRFFDRSELLPQDVCTQIAAEVREAVLGNRGAISSGRPAAVQGERTSLKEALHLIEQTITVGQARKDTGKTATISVADARVTQRD